MFQNVFQDALHAAGKMQVEVRTTAPPRSLSDRRPPPPTPRCQIIPLEEEGASKTLLAKEIPFKSSSGLSDRWEKSQRKTFFSEGIFAFYGLRKGDSVVTDLLGIIQ